MEHLGCFRLLFIQKQLVEQNGDYANGTIQIFAGTCDRIREYSTSSQVKRALVQRRADDGGTSQWRQSAMIDAK